MVAAHHLGQEQAGAACGPHALRDGDPSGIKAPEPAIAVTLYSSYCVICLRNTYSIDGYTVWVQKCGLCLRNLLRNSWRSATWKPEPEIKSRSNPQTLDPVTAVHSSFQTYPVC